MTSFYTEEELKGLGFRHIGNGVCISRKASIYGAQNISLGDHVRIDDFCILSGRIEIGSGRWRERSTISPVRTMPSNPCRASGSAWVGMIRRSAAASALIISRPRVGAQSSRM